MLPYKGDLECASKWFHESSQRIVEVRNMNWFKSTFQWRQLHGYGAKCFVQILFGSGTKSSPKHPRKYQLVFGPHCIAIFTKNSWSNFYNSGLNCRIFLPCIFCLQMVFCFLPPSARNARIVKSWVVAQKRSFLASCSYWHDFAL